MTESMNLLRGTLDALLLKALAGGTLHGYGIVDWVREVTGGVLEIEDGALYTSLHRMEASRSAGGARSSTISQRRGSGSSTPRRATGTVTRRPWARCSPRVRDGREEAAPYGAPPP
jgi:hypothetical protein